MPIEVDPKTKIGYLRIYRKTDGTSTARTVDLSTDVGACV